MNSLRVFVLMYHLKSLVKIWRLEDGEWVEEMKLEGHSDWVRDVAWAPSIGLPKTTIASCSQVNSLSHLWASVVLSGP